MKVINLSDYYPEHSELYIEVSDEVEELLKASIAAEKAYQRKMRYHHVAYIEDILSDIEKQTINRQRSLSEDVENKELKETFVNSVYEVNANPSATCNCLFL